MPVNPQASAQSLDRLARLLGCANQNAALAIEGLCSESAVLADGVHQSRPNAGQVEVAAQIRALVGRSQLARLAAELVPRFVMDRSSPYAMGAQLDPRTGWSRGAQPFRPDRYSVHCTLQIHGALLDQLRRARPLAEPEVADCVDAAGAWSWRQSPESESAAGRQHESVAHGVANLKAAIAAMSSISERRLAKLLDPTQNHGLPAALVPNPDGNHYGLMVLRYRAAVLVSELSDLATPLRTTMAPHRGGADCDQMLGTAEPTHIDTLCESLQSVLALERCAAVQALRVRMALLARVRGAGFAPTPGEFALGVIEQFETAGLRMVRDGRKLQNEIEWIRAMMLG